MKIRNTALSISFLLVLICSAQAQWQSIGGSGSQAGVSDWVYCLLADSTTDLLYVGGKFVNAGNSTSPFIAAWNGTQWQSMGSGFNAEVRTLCLFNGELYAGGYFTTSGNDSMNYVAKWNGSSWEAVGEGLNDWVLSLCVYNGELYAGGRFTMTGNNAPARAIAKWTGSQWVEVGGGLTGTGTAMMKHVWAMQVYNNQLYIGGYFNRANNNTLVLDGNLTKWNGFFFDDIPNYFSTGSVFCFKPYDTYLLVGGGQVAYMQQYNGVNWVSGPSSVHPTALVNNSVFTINVYDGMIIYGGAFTAAGGQVLTGEHINYVKNKTWYTLSGGLNNSVTCTAIYHDALYAGGAFSQANTGQTQLNYIARWLSPLNVSISKMVVTCNGGSNGSITLTPQNGIAPYTYHWQNGSTNSHLDNLTSGSYSVTVQDAAGRVYTSAIPVSQPAPINITGNVVHSSGNNGSVQLTVSGGTSPYSYHWSNGMATMNINNLAPGSYTVTIIDNNGCSTSKTFTVQLNTGTYTPSPLSTLQYITDNSILQVSIPNNTCYSLVIINISGSMVYEDHLCESSASINLSSLSPSVYFAILTDNVQRRTTLKFAR